MLVAKFSSQIFCMSSKTLFIKTIRGIFSSKIFSHFESPASRLSKDTNVQTNLTWVNKKFFHNKFRKMIVVVLPIHFQAIYNLKRPRPDNYMRRGLSPWTKGTRWKCKSRLDRLIFARLVGPFPTS